MLPAHPQAYTLLIKNVLSVPEKKILHVAEHFGYSDKFLTVISITVINFLTGNEAWVRFYVRLTMKKYYWSLADALYIHCKITTTNRADIETTAIQVYLDYFYSIFQGYILAKAERKHRHRQHKNVSS